MNCTKENPILLLEVIKKAMQNYVNKTWIEGKELIVADWNDIKPVIDYTIDDVKRLIEEKDKINNELLGALVLTQKRVSELLTTSQTFTASDYRLLYGNNEVNNAIEKATK